MLTRILAASLAAAIYGFWVYLGAAWFAWVEVRKRG